MLPPKPIVFRRHTHPLSPGASAPEDNMGNESSNPGTKNKTFTRVQLFLSPWKITQGSGCGQGGSVYGVPVASVRWSLRRDSYLTHSPLGPVDSP